MDLQNYDISIISDPHVLSGDLISNSEEFIKEIKVERKLTVESEALFKEALAMVDKANSQFLFLPGDLVKEGEYKSHEFVRENLLAWKSKNEDREIFLIPGNHDLNNHRSYDFKDNRKAKNTNPKEFYDLYMFVYENKYVLEMYKDSTIFHNYLDRINKEYDREEKYSHYAHGYFSYVARIPSRRNDNTGLSLICVDTSIYSADTEQNHRDNRENVPGSIIVEQMKWIVDKIDEAKRRNDLIFVMAHHALMPNFRNQELVFSPFIIKEWRSKYECDDPRIDGKTPIEVLADNGVKFVFTGHLHENGTAKYISEMGNIIYDVQTGSTVTYPLPIRHIKVINQVAEKNGYEVYIKTELIKEFTYMNLNGEYEIIKDAINYTIGKQLSLEDVVHNYIRIQANNPRYNHIDIQSEASRLLSNRLNMDVPEKGYVNNLIFPIIKDYFPLGNKRARVFVKKVNEEYQFLIRAAGNNIYIKASNLEESINIILDQIEKKILIPYKIVQILETIIHKVWSMPIDDDGHTFYDFVNYIYQYKPIGEDERPAYISKMIDNLNNPDYDIIDIVLDYASVEINQVFDSFTSSIKLEKDGSKEEFFDNLIQTEGWASKLTYKYLRYRVNNLRDLLDFFSKFLTGKKNIKGVDLVKRIVKLRAVRRAKENFSNQMFGQSSLRQFVIGLVNSMSDEMVEIYQNEELNELEKYFNYVVYDDTK